MRRAFALVFLLATVPDARAEGTALFAGIEAGGAFPQPFSALGAHLVFRVEAGAFLPVWQGRLGVVVDAGYAQPAADGQGEGAPVDGGAWSWSITQRELTLGARAIVLGPTVFDRRAALYGTAGPRVYFLETRANGGAAGEPFGEHTERSIEIGASLGGGVLARFGTLGVTAQVGLAASDLDHVTTGNVSTTAIEASLGALLLF